MFSFGRKFNYNNYIKFYFKKFHSEINFTFEISYLNSHLFNFSKEFL